MKRLLLPLLAVLALPTAVNADNAYGYGMQLCQMMRSGMDPSDAEKIVNDSIRENIKTNMVTTGIIFHILPRAPSTKIIGEKVTIVVRTAKITGFAT